MKQMIAAAATALLLCSASAAFAQDAAPASGSPAQTQAAVDMLKNMPADQRDQMFNSGLNQVQNLSPEQLKQLKAQFDSMTPEQKAEVQAAVSAQLQKDPQLQQKAEQQMQKMTPEQQQQLSQ